MKNKILFCLIIPLLVVSCSQKPANYSAIADGFEKELVKLESLMVSGKVTQKNMKAVLDMNDSLYLKKIEDLYQASIDEGKTPEYAIWLRVSLYRLIVLRDKSRKRISEMNEKDAAIYFEALAAVSNNVTMMWRRYFPDDRHVTEAVLSQ